MFFYFFFHSWYTIVKWIFSYRTSLYTSNKDGDFSDWKFLSLFIYIKCGWFSELFIFILDVLEKSNMSTSVIKWFKHSLYMNQPADFPQLTWRGHFSLPPPGGTEQNHLFSRNHSRTRAAPCTHSFSYPKACKCNGFRIANKPCKHA